VLRSIYSPRDYYERVKTFLREYHLPSGPAIRITLNDIGAFIRSLWVLGILKKGRRDFWDLLIFTLKKHPEKFALAVTMAIYGFHFRRIIETV
jgi:hypothetical protein